VKWWLCAGGGAMQQSGIGGNRSSETKKEKKKEGHSKFPIREEERGTPRRRAAWAGDRPETRPMRKASGEEGPLRCIIDHMERNEQVRRRAPEASIA